MQLRFRASPGFIQAAMAVAVQSTLFGADIQLPYNSANTDMDSPAIQVERSAKTDFEKANATGIKYDPSPVIFGSKSIHFFHLYIQEKEINLSSSNNLQLSSNNSGNSDVSIELILSQNGSNSLIGVDKNECKRQLVLKSN